MKTILKLLLAAFVLSLVPTMYVCAQGHIETPAERKARQEREAEAKRLMEQKAREQTSHSKRSRQQILEDLESNMVRVQGGTFVMEEKNKYISMHNVQEVTLSSFYLCKYEITQEIWETIMGDNPSYFKGPNRPVESVSWEDCQLFISKLNQITGKSYRLPTEAEWEYAARGGVHSHGLLHIGISDMLIYSGSNDVNNVAWYDSNSNKSTHDVGQKEANELGLYDMSGNVFEWCQDWYGHYSSSSNTIMNPQGASSGSYRVIRGGCWYSFFPDCVVTKRNKCSPTLGNFVHGLRLAM